MIGSDLFSIQIKKPTQDAYVGLRFENDKFGNVLVKSIGTDSLASQTPLRVGTLLFSVNGKAVVNMKPDEVAKCIRDAYGTVVILVQNPASSRSLVV